MNITTIVFDFGNVLGFFSHRKAAEQLAVYSSLSVEDILHHYLDSRLEDDFESGRMSLPAFREEVRRRCRVTCSDEQLDLAIADMFTPNHDVCALVPALKPRYRLVLLSNTNQLHATHFRRQFADTLGHFDSLVLSHEVGLRKPCADIYAHCHQVAGAAPRECLFIDDLPANIEAARACGWQGIVYHRDLDLRRELHKVGIELAPEERRLP
ncbi:MAG TPA: HAD family phosphatase [Gemmataceae bacterium]|nr:HAD family phosphatase [Gemmataceae bacterium]